MSAKVEKLHCYRDILMSEGTKSAEDLEEIDIYFGYEYILNKDSGYEESVEVFLDILSLFLDEYKKSGEKQFIKGCYMVGSICCLMGMYWDEDKYRDRVLDIFLNTYHSSEHLLEAGIYWFDGRYDEKILDVLLSTEESYILGYIMKNWPKHRCEKRVMDLMIDKGYWDELLGNNLWQTGNVDFTDDRIVNKVIEMLLHNYQVYTCVNFDLSIKNNIGVDLFKDRYAMIFFDKLLADMDAKALYKVGRDFTGDLFLPVIGHYLHSTRDQFYIDKAYDTWSDSKTKHIKKRDVIVVY